MHRIEITAVLLLTLTAAFLLVWTSPAQALASAGIPYIAAALAAYAGSLAIWSAGWAYLVAKSKSNVSSLSLPACCLGFAVSLLSLAGMLTPLNIGTDVLRSRYGKKYMGIEIVSTAAASIIMRECKLHLSLLLALLLIPSIAACTPSIVGRLTAAFSGIVALIAVIYAIRTDRALKFAEALNLAKAADAVRILKRKLGYSIRAIIYLVLVLGFFAEWEALRFSCRAVGISPDGMFMFAVFGLFYFLSRMPVIPLGIGLVESGGFAFLQNNGIPGAKAGALLLLWAVLRIGVPLLLAAVLALWFLASNRKYAGVGQTG